MTTRDIIIAVGFLAAGWSLHILWDRAVDWVYEATGRASNLALDLLALVGIVALCYCGYLIFR